jgi:ATP/maltotriose-dependent transcriptional regulator MalT
MNVYSGLQMINLAKTQPPVGSSTVIERECFAKLLHAYRTSTAKFILLEASAGAGKSSLLAQLYHHLNSHDEPIAWFSLDQDDRDPMQLLFGVATALQTIGGGVGSAAQALLHAGTGVPVRAVVTTLMNEIYAYRQPVTLLLDDLYLAESPENVIILQEMITKGPSNFLIVAASRSMPAINLAKQAARGEFYKFTTQDLRMSNQEAKRFFGDGYQLDISDDDIETLVERTDGWINGLQVVALSLVGRDDKHRYINELAKSQQAITDYIEEDVFNKLPAGIQTFLVYTSIFDLFTPDLCNAITKKDNSEDLINTIKKLNLFIITLDEKNHWYRYHHLFQEFLRERLNRHSMSEVKSIHHAAYQWCLKNQWLGEAVNHAIYCEDWSGACEAVETCRQELMTHNRLSTLEGWINKLPDHIISERPIILLTLGWCYAMKRDFGYAQLYLDRATAALNLQSVKTDAGFNDTIPLSHDMTALRSVIMINRGDATDMLALSNSADQRVPDRHNVFDSVYTTVLIYAHVYVGRFDKAHRLAVDQALLDKNENILSTVYSHVFRGWGYRQAGDLKSAKQQYEYALMAAEHMLGDKWLAFSVPEALLMEVYYEWDMMDEAKSRKPGLRFLTTESAIIEPVICTYLAQSRVAHVEGGHKTALDLIAEGEALGRQSNCNRTVVNMLSERVRLLLNLQQLEAAKQTADELSAIVDHECATEQVTVDVWSENGYLRDISKVRIELFTQNIDQSLSLLGEHIRRAKLDGRHYVLVNLFILESLVLNRCGKEKTALKQLSRAITLAATSGLIRSFVDFGKALAPLISKCLRQWGAVESVNEKPVDADYLATLKRYYCVTDKLNNELALDLETMEPLTAREQELLQQLSHGLKNRQIAEKLSLSENTVAWHLKNLYSKLQVSNRTSAVNVARRLLNL